MSFLPLALDTDPVALVDEALGYMADAYGDGWTAAAGSFEGRFFGANALLASVNRDTAVLVGTEIYKYLGSLYGLPPEPASRATVRATVTTINGAGYQLEQGRGFAIAATGDQAFAFLVQDTVTIPVDETTAEITLVAAEEGEAPNGLTGTARPIDALAFISSVVLAEETGGGADAEPIDDYLVRLRELFQLQAPRPILPVEFAVLARTVPTVHRSLALDGYNPIDRTTGNARMVAVWNIQEDGRPVVEAASVLVGALLAARRETTFVVNVVDEPDYTDVDVTYRAVALPGWDLDAVRSNTLGVVESFLSPATWGLTDRRGWRIVNLVRASQLEAAILRVPGVDYVDSLTIRGGRPDLTLTGVAPLARPGVITGTVTTAP